MPSYDFSCPSCGWAGVRRNVTVAERDAQTCECGQPLVRSYEIGSVHMDPKGGYQPAAIIGGKVVPGSFGGSSHARKKGFYRP